MNRFVRIATIACGLILTSAAIAQSTATPSPAVPAATAPTAKAVLMPMNVHVLSVQMKMTPDQVTKANEMDARYVAAAKGLSPKLTTEEHNAQIAKMTAARDKEFKNLLTADQVKAFSTPRQPTGAPVHAVTPTPAPNPAPTKTNSDK